MNKIKTVAFAIGLLLASNGISNAQDINHGKISRLSPWGDCYYFAVDDANGRHELSIYDPKGNNAAHLTEALAGLLVINIWYGGTNVNCGWLGIGWWEFYPSQ